MSTINSFKIRKEGTNTYEDAKIQIDKEQVNGLQDTEAKVQKEIEDLEYTAHICTSALYENGGLIYKDDLTDTYDMRKTANDGNIVDGSRARLCRVVGNTVSCNNLIPYPYNTASSTINGVTFTVNDSDGSVTVKGAATNAIEFFLFDNSDGSIEFEKNVDISVSGGVGTREDNNRIIVNVKKFNAAGKSESFIDTHNVPTNKLQENEELKHVSLYVYEGSTVNGTVYPMLNYGSTALPYEPYFEGLKSASFGGIRSTGRNLIPNLYGLVYENKLTLSGITYSVNKDGTITIDGTATANSVLSIATILKNNNIEVRLPQAGTCTLVSGIAGGSLSTYYLSCQLLDVSGAYIKGVNTINERASFEFFDVDLEKTKSVNIYFYAVAGQTFNNVVLTPMLYYGTEVIPYEVYRESNFIFPETELPLGDEIDFEQKKITRYGVTYAFNGTENWADSGATNSQRLRRFSFRPSGDITTKYGQYQYFLCDKYPVLMSADEANAATSTSIYLGQSPTNGHFQLLVPSTVTAVGDVQALTNGMTVHYVSSTLQSETEFDNGNEYAVWTYGTETVLDNGGSAVGAMPTLTQNYIYYREADTE